MKFGLRPFLWSAAALLLMLSVPTPLGIITVFLMMTPLIVLYRLLNPGVFAVAVAAILLLAYFLSGSAGLVVLILTLFFLVPSVIMGHVYKKGLPARTALLFGTAAILALLLVELALFSYQFGTDLSVELKAAFTQSFEDAAKIGGLMPVGDAAEMAGSFVDALVLILPVMLIYSSFLIALAAHGLSRWALRGTEAALPALAPARTWRVPRSLVFIYVIAIFGNLFIEPGQGGYWETVFANLIPVLQIVFVVQAIGFCFFIAHAKQWPRGVAILLSVPVVLLSQVFYIVGLIDAAFPLRKYFEKKQ